MGNFDAAAVKALMAAVKTIPEKTGVFRSSVVFHEPVTAPAAVPSLALWLGPLESVPEVSGLSEVSGRIIVQGRIYATPAAKVSDKTEEQLMTWQSTLLGAFAGAFTLGGEAMAIDLLGLSGSKISAVPGYVTYDGAVYRVSEVSVPIILDSLWSESP